MNLIKRLTTSVSASLDTAVGQLENHDAIVEATIKQTRQAVAKTRARINTLRQQGRGYDAQLKEAQTQMRVWTNRAKSLAETDQKKALECISRRNQCEADAKRLTLSVEQQRRLISDVTINLAKLQSKLEDMSHKHNIMRSRQTVADVNRAVASAQVDTNLNDTFERWESIVLEHELDSHDIYSTDALEDELNRQEDEEQLLEQLNSLTESGAMAAEQTKKEQRYE